MMFMMIHTEGRRRKLLVILFASALAVGLGVAVSLGVF
jgi:hypothetical protein